MPCPHIAPTPQPATSHNLLAAASPAPTRPMALPPKYRRRHTPGRSRTHTNDGRAPPHFVSEGSNTYRFPGPYTAKASKVAATSLSSFAATKLPTPPLPPQLARFHTNPRSSIVAPSSIHGPLSLSLTPSPSAGTPDPVHPRRSIHPSRAGG
jgi:hypothetical protein